MGGFISCGTNHGASLITCGTNHGGFITCGTNHGEGGRATQHCLLFKDDLTTAHAVEIAQGVEAASSSTRDIKGTGNTGR